MSVERLLPLALIASLCSCADEPEEEAAGLQLSERSTPTQQDVLAFNITNETCALYVAMHSRALEGPVAFGRDLEDIGVHWNLCRGGTMVACAEVSTVTGDTIRTGIPWPYRGGDGPAR